jgi:hypothetical protein
VTQALAYDCTGLIDLDSDLGDSSSCL